MLRAVLGVLLSGVVAACPLWCATGGSSACARAGHGAHEDGDSPVHPAPVNDDHCVCGGAILAAGAELPSEVAAWCAWGNLPVWGLAGEAGLTGGCVSFPAGDGAVGWGLGAVGRATPCALDRLRC